MADSTKQSNNQVDIHIIGGFLGSGKTTLLNQLLGELPSNRRVALIINEFGEIHVDGMLIEKDYYSMKEIMGGCVCCTLKVQLVQGLIEIIENEKPDEIYIEATGMAVPWEMKQNIEEGLADFSNSTVKKVTVCVDAKQYRKAAGVLPIYDRQFLGEPDVFLTKKDIYEKSLVDDVTADIACRYYGEDIPTGHEVSSEGPVEEIIQLTFTGETGPTAGELSACIEDLRGDIIRAKGIIPRPDGAKGEVLHYDGNRITVNSIPPPELPRSSLIVFCLSGRKAHITSFLSPLYA